MAAQPKLTVAQLRAAIKTRGGAAPSKSKKEDLLKIYAALDPAAEDEKGDALIVDADAGAVDMGAAGGAYPPRRIRPGIHVSAAGNPAANLRDRAATFFDAKTAQIFVYNPKGAGAPLIKPEQYDAIGAAVAELNLALYVHGSYVINPWHKDVNKRPRMWGLMRSQMDISAAIGARGVVVHLPAAPVAEICAELRNERPPYSCKLILEAKALAQHPHHSFESWAKLARLIDGLKGIGLTRDDVGICIDTAHISAGRAAIRTAAEAQEWLRDVDPEWVSLIHLNGNEWDGALRAGDKHAIPHSPSDAIWGRTTWENSGCRVFMEWCDTHNIDYVLEPKEKHTADEISKFMRLAGLGPDEKKE